MMGRLRRAGAQIARWVAVLRPTRIRKLLGLFMGGVGLFPAIVAALCLGLGIALGAQWVLHRFIATSTARAAPIDLTKLSLTVVAGVGGIVALVVAYRRQRDLEQGRFVERFGAAAAQLGNTDVAVRIAGVYAMAGVADESRGLRRQQCIDVLCGYLRLPYKTEHGASGRTKFVIKAPRVDHGRVRGETEEHIEYRQNDSEVRKTIVTVIADHLRPTAEYSWSTSNFNFRAAYLEDVNFTAARFSGAARFDNATFSGTAWFDDATFSSTALFSGARFSASARFPGATFSHGVAFTQTMFSTAWFEGARFFRTAYFDNATFSSRALFNMAEFSGTTSFDGAKFSDSAYFDGAMFFSPVSFREAMFSDPASFRSAMFSGTIVFSHAAFSGTAQFRDATFSGAARFRDVTFLGNASFDSARFTLTASFDRAVFSGPASFSDATFSGFITFKMVNFGTRPILFADLRQWGPPEPIFDWSQDISLKPSNVGPQDWPPTPATPAANESVTRRRSWFRLALRRFGQLVGIALDSSAGE